MAEQTKLMTVSAVAPVPLAFARPLEPQANGPCDPIGLSARVQLQLQRYAKALFTFTVAAPGADAVLAANELRTLFSKGIEDVGDEMGWGSTIKLTQQQTNLFPNGSLNNALNGAYYGRSIGVAVERPFVYDPATGGRTYSEVTDSYAPRAGRALLEALSTTIVQRDAGTLLLLGNPYHWPGANQVTEEQFPTADKALGASIILPLGRDYLFMDDNKGSQNQIILRNDFPLTLESDPVTPIPAGFSVPIMVSIYGQIIAASEACGTQPQGGATSVAQQARELAALGYSREQIAQMLAQR